MQLSQAVKRLQSILGFRRGSDQIYIEAISEAQEDFENGELDFLPWFLEKRYTTTVSEVNTAFPFAVFTDGFLREKDPYALFIKQQPIEKKLYHEPSDTGLTYTLTFEGLEFNRNPGDVYAASDSFVFYFYERDINILEIDSETQLSLTTRWLNHASKVLIGAAGMKLVGFRDRIARDTFQEMYNIGRTSVIKAHYARIEASKSADLGAGIEILNLNANPAVEDTDGT